MAPTNSCSVLASRALVASWALHNILVNLSIPCRQDHLIIFYGVIPHTNVVGV